jgi:hypothetical protein
VSHLVINQGAELRGFPQKLMFVVADQSTLSLIRRALGEAAMPRASPLYEGTIGNLAHLHKISINSVRCCESHNGVQNAHTLHHEGQSWVVSEALLWPRYI